MKSAGFDKKTVDAVLGELKKRKQVIIDGTTIALVGDAVHRKFESEIPALHASGMAVTSSAPLIMARAQITPAANEAKKKLGAKTAPFASSRVNQGGRPDPADQNEQGSKADDDFRVRQGWEDQGGLL